MLAFASMVAAVFAAIVFVEYRRARRSADARLSGESRIAVTHSGPVEFAIRGAGAPVLVVHGAGGGFDQGLAVGAGLVERGLSVIAMSRFGYLRTPLPEDASAEVQADAHAALLDALHIDKVAVVGVSAGAPSAMQLALRHPHRVSSLVLLVPAAFADERAAKEAAPRHTPAVFATALRSDFLWWLACGLARRLLYRAVLGTAPEVIDAAGDAGRHRADAMLDAILPVSPRRPGLLNDARVVAGLQRYELERIAAPTLAISAADDLYGTCEAARDIAARVPGARLVVFPQGGHLCAGHGAEVDRLIAGFCKRNEIGPNRDRPGTSRPEPGALLQGAG